MTEIEKIFKAVEDFNRKQKEYEEKMIIKICLENDFVVPSIEVREQLEKVLPKDTRIFVCPYVTDVLMIKRCVLDPLGITGV